MGLLHAQQRHQQHVSIGSHHSTVLAFQICLHTAATLVMRSSMAVACEVPGASHTVQLRLLPVCKQLHASGKYPLHRLAGQGCFQQGRQGRPGTANGTASSNQPLLHLFAAVHLICCCHGCGPQRYLHCTALLQCRDLQAHFACVCAWYSRATDRWHSTAKPDFASGSE